MSGIPDFQRILRQFFHVRWTSLLSGGLVVLLCWLLAQWTWLVLTPKTKRMSADVALLSATVAADAIFPSHLFGRAPGESSAPESQSATFSNLKLHGVFAAIGALPAFAILSVDGKPDQPVKAGMEIVPGVVLAAVYPDRVEVRRNGVVERLNLETRAVGSGGISKTEDFRLNVQSRSPGSYSFSRNELNQALQDPKQLMNLGKFVTRAGWKGLIVDEAPRGSLAEKLGLQQNDVVFQLNGQPVASNEDVSGFYQQLSQTGQVRLIGLRGGKALTLNYSIQ
jgi:general secretion pathway protein C